MSSELRQGVRDVLEYFRAMGVEHIPVEPADIKALSRPGAAAAASRPQPATSQKATAIVEQPATQVSSAATSVAELKEAALSALRADIGDCFRCGLSEERSTIVFGEGNVNARIMFIGEAPGREEDLQGRPFVGEAGELLTKLITNMGKEAGFGRPDVYIANIVKCRPPMNRDPQEDEIRACSTFLRRQIEIIEPRIIVALGRIAAHKLSRRGGPLTAYSITKERGTFFDYTVGGLTIPVMPTFHPAYLMRNPKDKWLTWDDVTAVLNKLREMK